MQKVIMFKIGHDERNVMHARGGRIFYPWLNSSDLNSNCYNSKNLWLSEFSSISQIIENIYQDKYQSEYIGVCHYRCLIGDIPEQIRGSYFDCLLSSEGFITDALTMYPGGIISTTYNKMNLKNWQQGPRWTGTKSIEYLIEAVMENPTVSSILNRYLQDTENSFKTVCCLPSDHFIDIFSVVCSYAEKLINLRLQNNDLTPRSVGYELETLTSALLIDYWRNNPKVARIKHTVL